ncbi:MAG: phosphotransferase system, mannose/fructose/N-acetylgalactosamine-specific component [Deltaproteobacteria bacterium]|nr:phosphotransferase system, mannose/fructose/N-acetylgalactosamine-specific component [Deltaproteobacteria bacterium]
MSLVLARIDCRLIHGQVVETWVPHVKANLLIVANDDLAGNPMLRAVMELAVPVGIRVRFCRLDEVIAAIAEADRAGDRSILLVSNASDALKARKDGAAFTLLNIGNLHFAEGKVQISPSVFFAPEDFEALRWFRSHGVSVCVKGTPFETGMSFEAEG